MSHEQLVKDLIARKSYSGEEEDIRDFIQEQFKQNGVEAFVQDRNLLVHIEGSDRTKAFIFNSHMDTVPEGDIPWKYGAWTPTIEGDRLIGLGASDMKAGMAASMLLAEQTVKQGKPPVDMWFTYVVNEEVDGSGTESFANWFAEQGYDKKYTDMAAIFTEPSNLKLIEHGHRGNYFLEVVAHGQSGHASTPGKLKGVSAVRKIINFADAFQLAATEWNEEFPNKYFNPAITVGEMTSIRANIKAVEEKDVDGKPVFDSKGNRIIKVEPSSANKFPDTCTAVFDLRTTPESHDLLGERVKKLGKKLGVKVGDLYMPAPAGFTNPDEKIVTVSRQAVKGARVQTAHGSADLGFLSAKGIKGIIFGPGEKSQMHVTDEYCRPAQIPQAVEIYKTIVEAWAK